MVTRFHSGHFWALRRLRRLWAETSRRNSALAACCSLRCPKSWSFTMLQYCFTMFHQSFMGSRWFLAVSVTQIFPFPPPSNFNSCTYCIFIFGWAAGKVQSCQPESHLSQIGMMLMMLMMMMLMMMKKKKSEDLRTKRAASQPSRSRDRDAEPGVPGNTWNVRPGNPISSTVNCIMIIMF